MARSGLVPRRRPSMSASGLPSKTGRAFLGASGPAVPSAVLGSGTRLQPNAARRREKAVASTLDHAQVRSRRRWSTRAERVSRAAVCKMA